MAGDLERGRARVEQDHLAVAQESAVARAIAAFAAGACSRRTSYGPRADRGRQRSAVDAPDEPRLGELLQVAADCVGRHVERRAQLGDDDLAVGSSRSRIVWRRSSVNITHI